MSSRRVTDLVSLGLLVGYRLLAIDGAVLNVADSAENEQAFGRPGAGRGEHSAFPQVRVVAVMGCGSHAVIVAKLSAPSPGETTLAGELLVLIWCGE